MINRELKLLVGIKEIDGNEYKPLAELVSDIPIPEKSRIHFYMRRAECIGAAAGPVHDLLTGNRIPEEFCFFSDGEYAWRTDTLYYFDKYNLILPQDFINKVRDWHPVVSEKEKKD